MLNTSHILDYLSSCSHEPAKKAILILVTFTTQKKSLPVRKFARLIGLWSECAHTRNTQWNILNLIKENCVKTWLAIHAENNFLGTLHP